MNGFRNTRRARVAGRLALGLITLVALVEVRRAHACDYILQRNFLYGMVPFTLSHAPPGGVWWVPVPSDDDSLQLFDDDNNDVPLVAVARGPESLAIEVPITAAAQSEFRLRSASGEQLLTVVAGEPPIETEPTLALVGFRAASTVDDGRPCEFDPHFSHNVESVRIGFSLGDSLPLEAALVDVWILEPDEPRPDDEAPRQLDAASAAPFTEQVIVDDAQFELRVADIGVHDVHVRVRDVRTAVSSNVEIIRTDIAEPELRGCGCASSTPVDAALIALAALALRHRRRRAA